MPTALAQIYLNASAFPGSKLSLATLQNKMGTELSDPARVLAAHRMRGKTNHMFRVYVIDSR
jgi:hypothetical protein